MSADNGIYILSTISKWKKTNGGLERRATPERVYRVAYAAAIDNFDWYEKNQPYNMGYYLFQIWGNSPVYETKQEALNAAFKLEERFDFLEYGINSIDTEYIFPED